ncbi:MULTISPECIES: hypothetical protein [Sorangium]|uniref:3-keto-disaccharide hydrolase domain-containing protein n=1 Tax=Sorangium cellulosum TaxID=56 RepID=A0A4P2QFM0_SORCE|nr:MULTISPECIES: hypothetical protein [Sorangium]AUX28589.1 hypothetical protein SOCE836_006620 [Sorangium cellulosum]WCQ87983.1 hypothetical protein NQZ70_00649 [Sorangium sp. Soce836]
MLSGRATVSVFAVPSLLVSASCVPEGPATGDTSARPAGTVAASTSASIVAGGVQGAQRAGVFEDDFDRSALGPDWNALSPKWKIEEGRLCVRGARNRGVWLRRPLPENARIEFDAIAEAPDGDLKAELWGDGRSGATAASYTNATSYLVILGGWKNTKHVLARLDEHGSDRLEIDVDPDSDDERARPVAPGQPYRFRIERRDGRTLSWSVNGVDTLELSDPAPLSGPGHEHLGFNDWDAPVCFDNLRITPL